jgi:uncharacterized protein YjbI with pentapeptide repeats
VDARHESSAISDGAPPIGPNGSLPADLTAILRRCGLEEHATAQRIDAEPVIKALARHEDRPLAVEASTRLTEHLIGTTSAGLQLSDVDLAGLDLARLDLRRANLSRAKLDSTSLDGTNLEGATVICPLIERTKLHDVRFGRFYAHALSMVSSSAPGADLHGALDCTGSLFHGVNFVGANLGGGNFAGAMFYQCDLTDADLSGAVFQGAAFNECVLSRTSLRNAKLDDVTMTRGQADGLVLDGACGDGLVLQAMTGLSEVSLRNARLPGLRIRRCTVLNGDFSGAYLARFDCLASGLHASSFRDADLEAARFVGVNGTANVFVRANLADAKLIDCGLPGSDLRGARAENAEILRSVLPDSSFSLAEDDQGQVAVFSARGLVVRDSDLSRANFNGAYLYRSLFTGDPVNGMRLDGADFHQANLVQAYVAASARGVKLSSVAAYARFNQSDLSQADLSGANLFQASLVKTKLEGANLSGVTPPVFLDRCPGIARARLTPELQRWREKLGEALASARRGST